MVAARAAPTGSQQMSSEQYGSARGSAGLTGASARDFANQAQGLGGLVRLYATYAANVFAVSAAFTALSNAADTANLIKGMNQIGAASGVALGTLSKRLVEVTDGAISMREAMETVTKGISSGMSTNQILEIGNVAKKASQALGVDMTDAVSRLSRGITKLEPELLDELGIFTRIDPAVQKYAQSIGRAANSLSDFERRQAFAIAVLEEGNEKFGAIELDANPYAKFLATLKDVGFTVLDVVNKAVVPLVSYLSQSPTALLTVLGAVGSIIVRQALPAFGQFRAGLESAAESAKERAIARAQDAAAAQKSISDSLKQAVDDRVEAEVEKVVIAEKRIMDIKQGSVNKQSALYKILEKDLQDINEKDLKKIESSAKGLETKGLADQAKAYRDVANAVKGYQREAANEEKARAREQAILQKNVKWYSIEGITRATAEKAKQQAIRASIVSNTAYQASLVGVTRAMIAANAAIKTAGITGFAAFTLQVKAGAAAIGGALATIGTAVNRLLSVVGIILTAYSILDSFLDGASKEIGKFDSAVDKANSSAEALSKTYETIYKNDPFSAQSVQARGTALMEVADGFKEVAKSAREAQAAIDQSWWAQLKEGIGLSGVNRNFGKSIATQLTSVLKNIDDPAVKKSLQDAARSQLGITELSFDKIAKAAKRLGASSKEIEKLQDSILGVATQAKIAGVASSQFAESYLKVVDQIGKINQKFAVSDDIAQFSINSGNALKDLETLMTQGVASSIDGVVKALEGIGTGTNIFGSMSNQLVPLIEDAKSFKQQFSEGSKEVDQFGKKLDELNAQEIDKSKFKVESLGFESFDQSGFNEAVQELNNQRIETAKLFAQAIARTNKAKADAEGVILKVQATLPKAMADSTNLLGIRLASQLAKASTQVLQGSYASFDAIPELVSKSSQLKLKEIDAQIANTKALRDLTTITVLSAARQKVTSAEAAVSSSEDTGTQATAVASLDSARAELKLLEIAVTDPLQALKLLAVEQENNTEIGKRLAGQVNELAARTVEYNIALQQLKQQRLSEELQGSIAVTNASIKQQQNLLKLKQDEIKLGGEQLNLLAQQENIGLDTKEQLNSQIALNREYQAEIGYRQKVLDLARNLSEASIRASVLPKAARETAMTSAIATYDSNVEAAAAQKAQDIEKARLDLLKAQSLIVVERINREEVAYNKASNFDKATTDSQLQLKQLKLDTELGVQTALLANSQLTEARTAEIEYQSTLQLAALEAERTKIQANQEFERQANINTFAQRKLLAADTGEEGLTVETVRKISEINDLEKAQKATRDGSIAQADALYSKTVLIADATRQVALEQAHHNQMLESAGDFANTLKMGFEGAAESSQKIAAALGDVATTMAQVAVNADQRAKSEKLAQESVDKAWESMDYNKVIAAEEAQADQKKKNAKQELADDAKLVNSSKKLFKEKTAAYKVLDATEKALHIKTLAREGVTLAKQISLWWTGVSTKVAAAVAGEAGTTAATGAGFASRLPIYIKEIYASWGKLGPWMVGAAALFIASKLGGSGGGSSAAFVPIAEQRQETQGTAMGWDSQGKQVQVRAGVLGDTSAKSTMIASSLERLAENSVVGLDYDNKMLKALKSIASGIEGAAKGLYRIPGIVSGSISGTIEGSSGSSGFLGIGKSSRSTTITDSGVQILGNMYELFRSGKARINVFETVQTTRSRSGFFGIGGGTSTAVDTFFQDLEETNARAAAQLRKALGSAGDVVYQMAEYAGVATDTIDTALQSLNVDELVSLRGLKGEEFVNELRSVMGAIISDASYAILAEYEEFANFGEDLGQTILRVQDSNKKIRQQLKNMMMMDIEETLSLRGVVPEARSTTARMASSITWASGNQGNQDWRTLSNMGGEIAAGLREAYAEGMAADGGASFTTLLQEKFSKLSNTDLQRLRDAGFDWANSVTTEISDGIARKFDEASIRFESIRITQDLIRLAGSEEAFYEQSAFFMENFLTEAERLIPQQQAVGKELTRLAAMGYTSADGLVDTREEFAQLVKTLDITDPAAREVRQAFLNIQEDFIAITPVLKDASLSAEDFASKLKSMQMRILELTGTPEQLLAEQRAQTLAETDDRLKSTQQYIFALEDVRAAEDALTKARQAEANKIKDQQKATEGLVNNLKRYVESLRKFRESLLLGSESPLTPAQRYEESRRQVTALYETAMGPATTPEEISARDAAMSQLEGSAKAFLDASKVYNASSAQYTSDFNLVQEALTKSISTFSQQLTYEEKNLVALNKQISTLETVNQSVLSVAQAIRNLDLAKAAVTAAAPARATITDTAILGRQGSATSISEARTYLQDYAENVERGTSGFTAAALYDTLQAWGVDSKSVGGLLGYSQQQVLDWFRNMDPSIPAFAVGTNFVPEDMLAQIHRGERIIPAADNAQLMQNLNNRDQANRVLVEEIRNLRSEVKQLREQQAAETGSIIVANFDAQQRAAEQIGTAMNNTAQQSNWTAKVRESVKLK
jgi:hypothetical protein